MASETEDTAVIEFTEKTPNKQTKWSREKEGSGHFVTTDKEAKAYRKNESHETPTRAGKSLS